MKKFIAHLKSVSPYSQSRYHQTEKLTRELHEAYEERTWRERMHCDSNGYIYIPGTQFAQAVRNAAKYLNIQIPGKGKSTFTKNFDSGIMVTNGITLDIKRDEVAPEWVHVPSDGKRGGTTRVLKCFGKVEKWEGDVTFYILDEIITEEVFLRVLTAAGLLIGVGRWRPRMTGEYGRFEVVSHEWIDE